MKKNKAIIMILVLMLGLMMSGCNDSKEVDTGNDDANQEQTSDVVEVTVMQYFASAAYIYDGQDEENGELMPPVEYKMTCKPEDNKYLAAVNSPRTLPEGSDQYYTALSDSYIINDVTVDDGVAYVDFSSENLSGGAANEIALIDQIVYTLGNSFEEIAAVQFTVDGQRVETLMDQSDISEPISPDYL